MDWDRRRTFAALALGAGVVGASLTGTARLTRNRYTQAVYDACFRLGLTATWLSEYVRPLDRVDATDPALPEGCTVRVCDPEAVRSLDAPVTELRPDEDVVAVFEGDTPRGYLFLSVDATHDIQPLEQRLTIDGAYVRRVFVAPAYRNAGLASAMLTVALDRAAERGATRASALVALDNTPSRRLFEGHGFAVQRVHRYARLGPLSYRSTGDA